MTHLLPCPFCGDKEPKLDYDLDFEYFFIVCTACGSQGGVFFDGEEDNPKKAAIDFWNTRALLEKTDDYFRGFNDAVRLMRKSIESLKPMEKEKNDN